MGFSEIAKGTGMVFTVCLIAAWYGSNIGVLLLNKYLLSHTSFKFPVTLTLCHMIACVCFGLMVSLSGFMPLKPLRSFQQCLKVAVLALIFCLTIVLGNASLQYIPVSFTQAIGTTTPFFTAIFAFFVQGVVETRLTYLTLLPVAGGVVIATGGEPLFNIIGFVAAVLATAGRALKTVVQSMLMSDPVEKLDPMSLLLYMSCASIALLVPAAILLEPAAFVQARLLSVNTNFFVWWLLGNSTMAYFVNLTNFLVTRYTSALTLQVLGNAKGVVAAIVSVFVFGNPVTWLGALGYTVTVTGVILYSEAKKRAKSAASKQPPPRLVDTQSSADNIAKGSLSPVHTDGHLFRSAAAIADKV